MTFVADRREWRDGSPRRSSCLRTHATQRPRPRASMAPRSARKQPWRAPGRARRDESASQETATGAASCEKVQMHSRYGLLLAADGGRTWPSSSPWSPSLPVRTFGALAGGCLIGLPVAAGNGAHRPADIVVDVIIQVRERDAHRPVGRGKAAAVEQDDAVVFGQPEHDVERMDVRLHPLHDVLAQVLAGEELEVDEAVVEVEELVRGELEVQPLERRLDALLDDADAGFLIVLLFVH